MSKVIVIDPGHGGWDPGAVAVDGAQEKQFNLALCLAVRDALAGYECRVILTRETDTALAPAGQTAAELQRRADVANNNQAALLVSLHHDNTGDRTVRGGSLWVWRKFDGPNVGWAAATGNHTDPKSHPIALRMVGSVRQALANLGVPWRAWGDKDGIATANFGILRNTRGPAVLIEAFHGSNAADVAAARRPEFVPTLARAIAESIAAALELPQRPPAWDPRAEIATLVSSSLINTHHEPDAPVTWGQLATVLNRLSTRK